MAEIDQDFEGDHRSTATTISFSHFLFGDVDDDDDEIVGLDLRGQSFNNVCSFFPAHEKTPKMLCFGGRHQTDHAEVVFGESAINTTKTASTTRQKSGLTCSDSSSACSDNNSSKSNRNNNGARESMQCMGAIVASQPASQRANKKSKVENPVTSTGHARLRKEKLGEGITALQQLVSPFGKTDTASVLHEAMGYISFLHDQVQVLSSPYLQHLPDDRGEESTKDLKSRRLCLVPVACTLHVENTNNGADFWSPAAMGKKTMK